MREDGAVIGHVPQHTGDILFGLADLSCEIFGRNRCFREMHPEFALLFGYELP